MRVALLSLLLTGCWPYLPGPYEDYVDGDSDTVDADTDTVDVDTEADTEPDTDPDTEADTEPDTDPDTEPDTDPDTEPDTDPDTEPDTDPDTDPGGTLETTIEDVRRGDVALGTRVQIRGARVSSPETNFGFFVQAGSNGANTGIYIFGGALELPTVQVGDRVDIAGDYIEFTSGTGSLSEIVPATASDVSITGTRNNELVSGLNWSSLPNTLELFESQVIQLSSSEVVSAPDNFGEFLIQDASGSNTVLVDDLFYAPGLPIGTELETITGILNYSFGNFKLTPRSEDDIVAGSSSGNCPADLCADDLIPGDVVITEVHFNPGVALGDDGHNEWVEVYNASFGSVNLAGATLYDGSGEAIIASEAVIPSGGYAILRRGNLATWGWGTYGVFESGSYGTNISFGNSLGETIALNTENEQIAVTVQYPTGQVGRSWNLDPSCYSNPVLSSCWCYTNTGSFNGSGDEVTPGSQGNSCF